MIENVNAKIYLWSKQIAEIIINYNKITIH